MIFKEDIRNRIQNDFSTNANEAFEILKHAIEKTDALNSDRLIRCIIFLANGNVDELNKYVKVATADPRDIMLWAEYEGLLDNQKYKRLRDFSRIFEESSME